MGAISFLGGVKNIFFRGGHKGGGIFLGGVRTFLCCLSLSHSICHCLPIYIIHTRNAGL